MNETSPAPARPIMGLIIFLGILVGGYAAIGLGSMASGAFVLIIVGGIMLFATAFVIAKPAPPGMSSGNSEVGCAALILVAIVSVACSVGGARLALAKTASDDRSVRMAIAAMGGVAGGIGFLACCTPFLFKPAGVLAWLVPRWSGKRAGRCQPPIAGRAPPFAESALPETESAKAPDEPRVIEWTSGLVAKHRPGWVIIHLPASGIQGDTGCFLFLLCFPCILATWTVLGGAASWLLSAAAGGYAQTVPSFLTALLVMAVLWFIVVGIVRAGRSRVDVVIDAGRMTFIKTGVLGTRRYSYAASDVAKVEVVRSGAEEQPEYNLQIEPASGTPASLSPRKEVEWLGCKLTELGDPEELMSLSKILREELNVKSTETPP
jgi:hypothetical protein